MDFCLYFMFITKNSIIQSIAQVDVTIGNIILPCQESCGSFVELKYHNDMTRTGDFSYSMALQVPLNIMVLI